MDEKSLNKALVSGINRGDIALELNDTIVDSLEKPNATRPIFSECAPIVTASAIRFRHFL